MKKKNTEREIANKRYKSLFIIFLFATEVHPSRIKKSRQKVKLIVNETQERGRKF